MTAYPTAEDYIRAVQSPGKAFRTPTLRGARFVVHPSLQIPMPASGNAAVVFRATVGDTDRALRFFTRDDTSSRERYGALGAHFVTKELDDCVAMSTWRDDAITVGGREWPLVEMQWVDGRTLDAYTEYLVENDDTAGLKGLAVAWRQLIARLQRAEFAHGDLQHGNVLIDTAGSLRLVDFDGAWIGRFTGEKPPTETGHPNYQRPDREWGRWMDTFPALIIYVSLLALARRPRLWTEFHDGENLLFDSADLTQPGRTPVWRAISAIGDPDVDRLVERLLRCCANGWSATGDLESLLTGQSTAAAVTCPDQRPVPSDAPWWVRATVTAPSVPGAETAGATTGFTSGVSLHRTVLPKPPPKRQAGPAAPRPHDGSRPDQRPRSSPDAHWYEKPQATVPELQNEKTRRGVAAGVVLAMLVGLFTAVVAWIVVAVVAGLPLVIESNEAVLAGSISGSLAAGLMLLIWIRR